MKPHNEKPAISSTLYLGLLFAQEDAGGELIPGRFGRRAAHAPHPASPNTLRNGDDACGCIHGAAFLWGGQEHGNAASEKLEDAGITFERFDEKAFARKAFGLSVTVDSTLLDCGVEVKEER